MFKLSKLLKNAVLCSFIQNYNHMRIHRPLADAVVGTLQEIFLNKRQADRAVEYVLKSNRKWGSRDRSFIAENTYEIVKEVTMNGGSAILLDCFEVMKNNCSKYIELQLIK